MYLRIKHFTHPTLVKNVPIERYHMSLGTNVDTHCDLLGLITTGSQNSNTQFRYK